MAVEMILEPAFPPTVAVPKAGERFSDEELHARFGVPTQHGIRVSGDNRCIVLVHLVGTDSGYTNTDRGAYILYMGENSDRYGLDNQKMAGGNLSLRRSMKDGYTVLYFLKEENVLVFRSRVEYDSHEFLVDMNRDGDPRVVVEFKLRTVHAGKMSDAAVVSETGTTGPRHVVAGDADLEIIDSPPLTPDEIAAVKDFFSAGEPRTISKEEFLSIVMDDKKLEERIQRLESQTPREVVRDDAT